MQIFCITSNVALIMDCFLKVTPQNNTYILQSRLLTKFLTPLMLCVLILYIRGGTYILKSTPNDRFFEKLFLAIFIYSQSFCQKCAERKSPKKYFSYLFWCLAWGSNPCFTSNKPTYNLLDYGDVTHEIWK